MFLSGSSGGLGPLVPCREGEGLVHTAIPGRGGTTLSRSLCAAWYSTGAFPGKRNRRRRDLRRLSDGRLTVFAAVCRTQGSKSLGGAEFKETGKIPSVAVHIAQE